MKTTCVLALAGAGAASAFMPATPVSTTVKAASSTVRMAVNERSTALPFDARPEALDGTLVGDVGFDPAGFSNNPPRPWLIGGDGPRSLKWYREAELVHGRVAMLAALGWFFPEIWHFPGNQETGLDAYAETNPFAALNKVPEAALWQIAAAASAVEVWRIGRVVRGDAEAGDLALGQGGAGRLNPFGLNYDAEEYQRMQLREIKNGRLAMIAVIGMALQTAVTGQGLLAQLSGGFSMPIGESIAGDFFPAGL